MNDGNYTVPLSDVTEALILKLGLTEGRWRLVVHFANVALTEIDMTNPYNEVPVTKSAVTGLGLKQTQDPVSTLVRDASVVQATRAFLGR